MENKNTNTLEFIQLIKCIIEYYGTTVSEDKSKTKESEEINNSIESQLSDAEKILGSSFTDFNLEGMSVKIPSELDETIKKTFLHNLKKFQ